MFDIGWTELLLIGLVALIVVGPKDLPGMFRTLGQFTAKMRRMAREFSQAMEAAADDAGVKDVTTTLRDVANPKKMGLDAVKKAADFDKWSPDSETGKLAKERAEKAAKIRETAAKKAEARAAKEEAAEKVADAPKPAPAPESAASPAAEAETTPPKAET
ncbi:Sec-independent protein translocase protein TatB [Litoreibacter roseus]|uniref:Sec-independent protein translocase protein TatB n=1 Tax=Litoreibacter roseus TaxID=2601869 RepID=A0A6N6JHW3_9RHOB|nr:Sec-independent protein translocase protein TatB [Litoreibacter roseus]GFE65856.1 hypothetical protein KIN_29300 [Litoreibacter roseus]